MRLSFDSICANVPFELTNNSFVEEGNMRTAYLFGEGIWKWRMDYYLEHKNFTNFDIFIDKTGMLQKLFDMF